MGKQINIDRIIPTALHQEMERSYLEYAMSVIVGRALPDVRDGLKPVHRRILYAMYELGLTPDKPYRKCARVVGDVLGKYHPHGDQSVYDALVRMVQDFSSRYPLLAGHGNFGSIDNDPPAAMRYTETRLASISYEAMLGEIGEATVDFTDNFDSSQQEPVVLPVQLPILLINGCSGIAVGMATNVPPHNLGEIVDSLVALIDKPELSDEELWRIIPGPDFPTGGQIIDREGIKQTYATGRGIIPLRGVTNVETVIVGKSRKRETKAIVVTEFPYQVNKAAWIEKVADLVNQGRIEGISDLRDESDRTGIRVVIELKKDISPQGIIEDLYKLTPLQHNFGAIMLGLVDKKPCQLSLRELLQEFLKFREETLTKQYHYELEECQQRLHLVSGLLTALNNLDGVINILRNSPDGTTAKLQFQEQFEFSNTQSDAILAMPMRRLTGLEKQKLEQEFNDLETRISQLSNLLNSRHELLKELKKQLRSLKRKFADERRTEIVNQPKNKDHTTKKIVKSHNTIPSDAVVEITHQGEISWQESDSKTDTNRAKNTVIFQESLASEKELTVITDTGKAYPITPEQLKSNKQNLFTLLPKSAQRDSEAIVAHFYAPEGEKRPDMILLTSQGRIKRISLSEIEGLTNRGSTLIKLRDSDRLKFVSLVNEDSAIAIATNTGRILRFSVGDRQLPIMGRSAQGNQALRLRFNEEIVGCVSLTDNQDLILISELGYGKRLLANSLRLASIGDLGNHAFHFTSKLDNLAGMLLATGEKITLLTNQKRNLNLGINDIPTWGKDGAGDRLVKLKTDEKIISIF
jgi:DNA gyrase subunit A